MSKKRRYTKEQLAIIRGNYAKKAEQAKSDNSPIDMHLAKIKNRYMFNSNNPSGEHTYAVYTDKDSKETRAVPTTHLYVPDKQNMEKLHKGLLCKVKFAGYETPSGVGNYYYNSTVDNKQIDLKHSDITINKTKLPQKQAQTIKAFANRPRKTP